MLRFYVRARTAVAALKNEEEGQALVEYGMLVALIAVVCIVAVTATGTSIQGVLNSVSTALAGL